MSILKVQSHTRLVFTLSLSFLLCSAAHAEQVEPKPSEIKDLPVQLSTTFITVVSDKPLSQANARRVVDAITDAYKFDLQQLGWQQSEELAKPMTVGILSIDWMKKHDSFFQGGTFDKGVFALCERFFVNPVYTGVTAHELTHMLVIRKFGAAEPRDFGWSADMGEGLALHNGKEYRLLKQNNLYPDGLIPANDIDQNMTAKDVEKMYSLEKDAAEAYAFRYPIGQQFIEFLRVRLNGKGEPDTIQKLGLILNDMAKNHTLFSDEFKSQFHTKLSAAHDQFIQFIAQN